MDSEFTSPKVIPKIKKKQFGHDKWPRATKLDSHFSAQNYQKFIFM